MQDTSPTDERHEAATMLLPWYATGRLDPQERASVEAHLQDCPRCRAALEVDRRMPAALDQPVPTADAGWAAMQARLDAVPPLFPKPTPRQARDRRRWSLLAKGPAGRRRLQWLVAGQAAAIVLLAGWIAAVPTVQQPSREGPYRALSSGSGEAVGNVLAMFRPTTTESELRRVLGASNARVVDGPTSAGAYVLAVPGGANGPGLARLRRESAVTMAEPINGEDAS